MLIPCGFDSARTLEEWAAATKPDWLADLRAVQTGRVYALDAASYFSRPGPRVVEGIALLAELFDPHGFEDELPPAAWLPVAAA